MGGGASINKAEHPAGLPQLQGKGKSKPNHVVGTLALNQSNREHRRAPKAGCAHQPQTPMGLMFAGITVSTTRSIASPWRLRLAYRR